MNDARLSGRLLPGVALTARATRHHHWFEVTPKHAALHPFILAVMSRDLARSFGDTVARMVIDALSGSAPIHVNPAAHDVFYKLKVCPFTPAT